VDGIHEQNGVNPVERTALPLHHAVHDLVGEGGDGLLGDLRPVDLGQVSGDLAMSEALRCERQDHLVDSGQPPLPLPDDLRLERARGVTRDLALDRPDVGQHGLGPAPVAGVAAAPAAGIVLLIAEVISDLTLQGRFQDPLGQLLQQPTLPGQLPPLRSGPLHQHRDQLLIGHGRRLPGRGTLDRLHGLQLHGGVSHLTSLP
jgi:hypothetical protein